MKVAVVGATGLVGSTIMNVLEEKKFPVSEFLPVASEKSVGKKVRFANKEYAVISLEEAIAKKPHIAIFSAGSALSLEWAPKFAQTGTFVIDNSSAWRMHEDIKLIVPEINGIYLTENDKIIANPNCSSTQMLVALAQLHYRYKIKRIVVATYQAVTGTGIKAVRQMESERNGTEAEMAYPYQIDKNCLPHCDIFLDNGYTKEEMKLVNETRKIFNDPNIQITATAVRVPVVGGHSEAVNVEFEHEFNIEDIPHILAAAPGVELKDDIKNNIYPMPKDAQGSDAVFVGRIRRDFSAPKCLNMWIVADNLRKGAASNAVQIAEYVLRFIKYENISN
ncbi:MAG: aspartate-semialdehyde dehydrogenase [Bacteroidia bacterium]|nr:MAG: aspartate-semialdehyde dehydrogenase [Bacteroidia bacterium]